VWLFPQQVEASAEKSLLNKEVKKMKMKFRMLILIGILALVWAGSALAADFVHRPDDYTDGVLDDIGWSTSFPYQRNIMWDFNVDPTIAPGFFNDPTADVHYQGYDDPYLWFSDFVVLDGVEWFPGLGMIGIDNTGGTGELYGYATFHIDNWPDPNQLKHIWLEMESIQTPPIFLDLVFPTLIPAPGSTKTGDEYFLEHLPGDRHRENHWWEVMPNPPWEEIVLNFYAPAGEMVFVDSFHVATECIDDVPPIPEPSTILLLGCGALGLFGIIIRNRRKQKNNSDE